MEIRELQYFLQVAREQSFTKAAEQLYLSQPALSKTVKKLERELGVSLFEKRGTTIVLTDCGSILMERAASLLKEHDNIKRAVQDTMLLTEGKVRAGITPIMGSLFFAPIIASFCSQYPRIELILTEGGSHEIGHNVAQGTLDLGVCVWLDQHPDLHVQTLLKDEMVAFIHINNPLAHRGTLRFDDLRDQPINLYNAGYLLRDQIVHHCEAAGFYPSINISSAKSNFLLQMTACGSGISILPRPYARVYTYPQVRMVSFTPQYVWHICLVTAKDHYLSYAAREFISKTTDAFADMRQQHDQPDPPGI